MIDKLNGYTDQDRCNEHFEKFFHVRHPLSEASCLLNDYVSG